MRKLFLAAALLLPLSLSAAPCTPKTVQGTYTYKLQARLWAVDRIGQVVFDGKGGGRYNGKEIVDNNMPVVSQGYGRYSVDGNTCILRGDIQYADGTQDTYQIFLNNIKGNIAYGGDLIGRSEAFGINMNGTINKVISK